MLDPQPTGLSRDDVGGYRPALSTIDVDEFLLMHLSIFGETSRPRLVQAALWHHYDADSTEGALLLLIYQERVRIARWTDVVCLPEHPHPWRRLVAQFAARCWERSTGPRWLMLAVAVVTLLCVALTWAPRAKAADVPDRIVAALVQVESGCEWRSIGDVRGTWSRGQAGEVSPFQLSPIALIEMGAADRLARIHRDPVLAESFARLWLSRCYVRHGNWPDALAAYNAGSRYRSRTARDYSARVLNLAASF